MTTMSPSQCFTFLLASASVLSPHDVLGASTAVRSPVRCRCTARPSSKTDESFESVVFLSRSERQQYPEFSRPFTAVLLSVGRNTLDNNGQIVYRTALDRFGIDLDAPWATKYATTRFWSLLFRQKSYLEHSRSSIAEFKRPTIIEKWLEYWLSDEFDDIAAEVRAALKDAGGRQWNLVLLMNGIERKLDDLAVCFCGQHSKRRLIAHVGLNQLEARFGLDQIDDSNIVDVAVRQVLSVFLENITDEKVQSLFKLEYEAIPSAWDEIWNDPIFDQVASAIGDLGINDKFVSASSSPLSSICDAVHQGGSTSEPPPPEGLGLLASWPSPTFKTLSAKEEDVIQCIQRNYSVEDASGLRNLTRESVARTILLAMMNRFNLSDESVDQLWETYARTLAVMTRPYGSDGVKDALHYTLRLPEGGSEYDWMRFFCNPAFDSISPAGDLTTSLRGIRAIQEGQAFSVELSTRLRRIVSIEEAHAALEVILSKFKINLESAEGRCNFLKVRHAVLTLELRQELSRLEAVLTQDNLHRSWNTLMTSRQFDQVAQAVGIDLPKERERHLVKQRTGGEEHEKKSFKPKLSLSEAETVQLPFVQSVLELKVNYSVSSAEVGLFLQLAVKVFGLDLAKRRDIQELKRYMVRLQNAVCEMEVDYIFRAPADERRSLWKKFLTGWVFVCPYEADEFRAQESTRRKRRKQLSPQGTAVLRLNLKHDIEVTRSSSRPQTLSTGASHYMSAPSSLPLDVSSEEWLDSILPVIPTPDDFVHDPHDTGEEHDSQGECAHSHNKLSRDYDILIDEADSASSPPGDGGLAISHPPLV